MDQELLPIVEALQKHDRKNPTSMHVPGHKNGRVMPAHGQALFSSVLPFDQTELTGLDDLHAPDGVIACAQKLAAAVYGAKDTLFLVGGSTAGNLTMILASFRQGDTVLVQRDSHKSIINGLRLAGLRPVFIFPKYDNKTQLSLGVTESMVEQAFVQYPQAKGLIITSPSYYGWTQSLSEIIHTAHKRGAKVLVDEAHGAHFPASSVFPPSALEQGADVVVHSAHKTLPALTMGAFLHLGKTGSVSLQALKDAAAIVQSSSPSYPILASLDIARHYVHTVQQFDQELLARHFLAMKSNMKSATGLTVVSPPDGIYEDPLKCIVQAPTGYSGWTLQHYLEEENIYPELADSKHVLFIFPLVLDTEQEGTYTKIRKSVNRMMTETPKKEFDSMTMPTSFFLHEAEKDWADEMFHVKQQQVPLMNAKNLTAGTDIIPYPPGIPLFLKGEKIMGERYDFLVEWLAKGGRIQGGEMNKYGDWYLNIINKDENE